MKTGRFPFLSALIYILPCIHCVVIRDFRIGNVSTDAALSSSQTKLNGKASAGGFTTSGLDGVVGTNTSTINIKPTSTNTKTSEGDTATTELDRIIGINGPTIDSKPTPAGGSKNEILTATVGQVVTLPALGVTLTVESDDISSNSLANSAEVKDTVLPPGESIECCDPTFVPFIRTTATVENGAVTSGLAVPGPSLPPARAGPTTTEAVSSMGAVASAIASLPAFELVTSTAESSVDTSIPVVAEQPTVLPEIPPEPAPKLTPTPTPPQESEPEPQFTTQPAEEPSPQPKPSPENNEQAPPPKAQPGTTTVILNNIPVTIIQPASSSIILVNSNPLSVGGPATTLDTFIISAGSSGLETAARPTTTKTGEVDAILSFVGITETIRTATAVLSAEITIGSTTLVVSAPTGPGGGGSGGNGVGGVVVEGQTLTSGGVISVAGETLSLASEGTGIVIGSSTATIPSLGAAPTFLGEGRGNSSSTGPLQFTGGATSHKVAGEAWLSCFIFGMWVVWRFM